MWKCVQRMYGIKHAAHPPLLTGRIVMVHIKDVSQLVCSDGPCALQTPPLVLRESP